jgi:hypothetical protein
MRPSSTAPDLRSTLTLTHHRSLAEGRVERPSFPATRPERAMPAQPVAGDPAVIDPALISQPDHDDKPAATAERAWLERDSMAAPGDFRSDWAFFD